MMTIHPIAHIRTDFPQKFGLPRQSGLVEDLAGQIIFEEAYRDPEALRGIEGYDYLWLLWEFEVKEDAGFRPTVRPPRLGGNERMGVFATRSPFRPNHMGLSSVRLLKVEITKEWGPVLHVSGIDMRDGTPVYDIKPYLAYTDAHPEARGGFTEAVERSVLQLEFPEALLEQLPGDKRAGVLAVLESDIRPSYHHSRGEPKDYGLSYAGYNIRFRVEGNVLTVTGIKKEE